MSKEEKAVQEKTEKLYWSLDELLEPNASFKLNKGDIGSYAANMDGYVLTATPESMLEGKFNDMAALYLHGREFQGDNTLPGTNMKNMLTKLGDDGLPRAKAAIEAGNLTKLIDIFNDAYVADKSKVEPTMATIREQDTPVKMGVYGNMATEIAGPNGDPVKVAENVAGAIQAIQQKKAGAKNFSTYAKNFSTN